MAPATPERILVVNTGSSSVKYQLIDMAGEHVLAKGQVAGIGGAVRDHDSALATVFDELGSVRPDAVGHRVVHGGTRFSRPVLVDDAVLEAIEALTPLAPLHNPANVAGIRSARLRLPKVPHVAVFDTAFHHTIPAVAATYGLPLDLAVQHGIRRYGFHGTNCAWCLSQVALELGRPPATLNLIVAHLGAGASITAIRRGISVDTSMGMTPLEGVMMQTRSGDVDPGALLHLLRSGMSADALDELLNHRSGLKGLAGEADMKALADRSAAGDEAAAFAREVYCYRIAKAIASYVPLTWPLDALVFTGGIGENDGDVRAKIYDALRELNLGRVLVVPANEELQIARETRALVAAQ
jgi:acetate kinase